MTERLNWTEKNKAGLSIQLQEHEHHILSNSEISGNSSLVKFFLKFKCWVSPFTREGNGTPLQYSCLENPMDGGAWWAAVHGVANSRTRLSDFTFTFHFHALEKEMATHSSDLAWRIPEMGEPGSLQSMGSHRVRHDWIDLAAAAAASPFTTLHISVDHAVPYTWIIPGQYDVEINYSHTCKTLPIVFSLILCCCSR